MTEKSVYWEERLQIGRSPDKTGAVKTLGGTAAVQIIEIKELFDLAQQMHDQIFSRAVITH